MAAAENSSPLRIRHASPPLGIVAAAFALLFLAGLYPVTMFGGQPYFPGPGESAETIVAFFRTRPTAVLVCAALHFGAAIPLGIFAASVVSRLQFLGVRAAGASIALFGGLARHSRCSSRHQSYGRSPIQASCRINRRRWRCIGLIKRLEDQAFPCRSGCSWQASPFRQRSQSCFRSGW